MKITVCSRLAGGHRRAGKYIPDGQTELDVTEAELKAIKADRNIVCIEPATKPPKDAK